MMTSVVSYEFSTSNHNRLVNMTNEVVVVSYEFSTSNHNLTRKKYL